MIARHGGLSTFRVSGCFKEGIRRFWFSLNLQGERTNSLRYCSVYRPCCAKSEARSPAERESLTDHTHSQQSDRSEVNFAARDNIVHECEDDSESAFERTLEDGFEHSSKEELKAGLYLVSTPIGNLADITYRAVRVLRRASCVFAEDTRRARVLCQKFEIRAPLISCHSYNEERQSQKVVDRIRRGEIVALVSDAGTPCVSDPGSVLVQTTQSAGLPVVPIPGASAAITALVGSGLNTDTFLFVGFLPSKQGARNKKLQLYARFEGTLIFYVPPYDLLSVLKDCIQVFGDTRECCLARELTKRHEEFIRKPLADVFEQVESQDIKGEVTLLIGPCRGANSDKINLEVARERLLDCLGEGMSVSYSVKKVAQELGVSRSSIYQIALDLKDARET